SGGCARSCRPLWSNRAASAAARRPRSRPVWSAVWPWRPPSPLGGCGRRASPLGAVDPRRQLDVGVGDAARGVRGEHHADVPVALDVDVGMVVRGVRRLRDAVRERHGGLEALEYVRLRQRITFAAPAGAALEERLEGAVVESLLAFRILQAASVPCTACVRGEMAMRYPLFTSKTL